jgi:cell division protein FtsB
MKLSPARQVLLAVLTLVLLGLQARLWIGEGSLRHVATLEDRVAELEQENRVLRDRNALMAADVEDLKDGMDTIEEIARRDLGMIRDGETFFLLVEEPTAEDDDAAAR